MHQDIIINAQNVNVSTMKRITGSLCRPQPSTETQRINHCAECSRCSRQIQPLRDRRGDQWFRSSSQYENLCVAGQFCPVHQSLCRWCSCCKDLLTSSRATN